MYVGDFALLSVWCGCVCDGRSVLVLYMLVFGGFDGWRVVFVLFYFIVGFLVWVCLFFGEMS